jgi:adenylyltransferase/sulfurtransferase
MTYVYLTGDLARWLPDGTVEFLGRIDKQVKVRGYRIELGEIESRLRKHDDIGEALVVVREEEKGDKYLCAYIVPKAGRVEGESISGPAAAREVTGQALSFVRRFEETVKKNQNKPAVKSNGRVLTYGMLDKYANRVAREILEEYDDTHSLSKDERLRYKRQMLLHGWGIASQEKLKGTTVFVAGAGGGASPTIMQLALIGFGSIKVCDFDEVELSNLNRQFLHNLERLGMNKALSAKLTISKTNPNINVITYTRELTRENAAELVGDSAIIFDMFDGPADKFILSEYAVAKGIPHLILAMTDINAYAAVFHPPDTPCYHCIFDKRKLETIVSGMQHVVENYSKNPLPVVSTSLFISSGTLVNEALKILLGFDKPAYNKFFYFNQRGATRDLAYTPGYKAMTHLFSDHFLKLCKEQGFDWDVGWRGNFLEELKIEPNPNCPLCGEKDAEKGKKAPIPMEIKEKAKTKKEDGNKKRIVALLLNHDIEMAVGLAGVLKSGKAYVPFDPASSMQRLSYMLEDSEARIILTDNRHFQLAEKLRDKVNQNVKVININRIEIDEPGASHKNFNRENPGIEIEPEHPAYIAYPPDSTSNGTPGFNSSNEKLYQALLKGNSVYSFDLEGNREKTDSTTSPGKLRSYLLEDLPDYMIPSHFVRLAQIPLTPNGKVDIKALPEPGTEEETQEEVIAPSNEVEKKLVEIWSEVLEIEKDKIGINSNFFQLGGHSLKATILIAKIHNQFNLRIPLNRIFQFPTLLDISKIILTTELINTQEIDFANQEVEEIVL